ncbi:MAG: DUF924 family protein [Gammaproteobacteria bacterium]|nr:DUF924 domain-containing protein [Pseudomonadales bacterium]MCP5347882.1 DUF924 domain-containing protein [Pseudomonadales bacterium]
MNAEQVIRFWFTETGPAQRFKKDPAFDQLIIDKFSDLHRRASQCELVDWRATPEGALAEIIVLDQFSRNMFRDTPEAFAWDPLALALAQELVRRGDDQQLDAGQRAFAYMPYMHSESKAIHELAMALFSQPGLENNYKFELRHKEIIDRFGRYPHRNAILGRQSSADELQFLELPGSSF